MSELAIDLNLLRWISDNSGRVYDNQLVTLKRTAMLLGGGPVTMALSSEAHTISYTIQARSKKGAEDRLREATAAILGPSWKVEVVFEKPDVKQPRKGAEAPKRKRAGRLQKVRRKR